MFNGQSDDFLVQKVHNHRTFTAITQEIATFTRP